VTAGLETDVLVVGGGPAGSAAATTLARAGVDVVLVDKARFPRDKCCGDGLTTGALRRLDALGLDPLRVESFTPVESLAVRSEFGRVAHLPLSGSDACKAAVARRRDLDAALLELARGAGATVLEGHGLEALEVEELHGAPQGAACTAGLSGGLEVRSRYVVAADGAWSKVRAQLAVGQAPRVRGGRVLEGDWHAYRAYVTGISSAASERLWVWFDPALLPGYAWSFPLAGGVANVGICVRRTAGVSGAALASAWRDELEGPFLSSLLGGDAALEAPAKSWPIPSGIDRVAVAARGGRVLYVGDAAYAADPFTGEGIAQALETGAECAEAIIDHGARSPERVGASYREQVRASLALEHRLSRVLSSIVSAPLGARGAVRVVGLNAWTRRNAGRWLYEDVRRTIPLTPRRWRRGALRLPTPYPRVERVEPPVSRG
jgi:geranylgeranyl reductase family protein